MKRFALSRLMVCVALLGVLGIRGKATASETKPASSEPAGHGVAAPEVTPGAAAPSTPKEQWLKFPSLEGQIVGEDGKTTVKTEPGRLLVVIFLASWCEPCQDIMTDLKQVEAKYSALHTRFVYVFAHDANQDALGFRKEYKLPAENALIAGTEILKDFHNPPLPTLYVADRFGWLAARWTDAKRADVVKLEEFLKYTTAY